MENSYTNADFNDIVFEGRNKQYGAYFLRREYDKHLRRATLIAIAGLVLILLSPYIIAYLTPKEAPAPIVQKVVKINELDAPPPLDEKTPPPPPPTLPPPEKIVKFVPPKPVEHQVEEEPPTNKELEKAPVTGSTSQEGTVEYEPPKETQIIEKPKEPEFAEFVEEDAKFPGSGGAEGWLAQHLNYPEMAKENNIQGTVYVTAFIDDQGNIVDVKPLKGIPGLTEEAIRVVKSMPKWIPGKNNGHPVGQKLNIPIKFVLK